MHSSFKKKIFLLDQLYGNKFGVGIAFLRYGYLVGQWCMESHLQLRIWEAKESKGHPSARYVVLLKKPISIYFWNVNTHFRYVGWHSKSWGSQFTCHKIGDKCSYPEKKKDLGSFNKKQLLKRVCLRCPSLFVGKYGLQIIESFLEN